MLIEQMYDGCIIRINEEQGEVIDSGTDSTHDNAKKKKTKTTSFVCKKSKYFVECMKYGFSSTDLNPQRPLCAGSGDILYNDVMKLSLLMHHL